MRHHRAHPAALLPLCAYLLSPVLSETCATIYTVTQLSAPPPALHRTASVAECGVYRAQGGLSSCDVTGTCVRLDDVNENDFGRLVPMQTNQFTITNSNAWDAAVSEHHVYTVHSNTPARVTMATLTGTEVTVFNLSAGGMGRSIAYLPWLQKIVVGTYDRRLYLMDMDLTNIQQVTTTWPTGSFDGLAAYQNQYLAVATGGAKNVLVGRLNVTVTPPAYDVISQCAMAGDAMKVSGDSAGNMIVSQQVPDAMVQLDSSCTVQWTRPLSQTPGSNAHGVRGEHMASFMIPKSISMVTATTDTPWFTPSPLPAGFMTAVNLHRYTLVLGFSNGEVRVYRLTLQGGGTQPCA